VKKVVAKKTIKGVTSVKGPKTEAKKPGHHIQLSYTILGPGKDFDPNVNLGHGGVPANGPIFGPPTPPKDGDGIQRRVWKAVELVTWPGGKFAMEIGVRFIPLPRQR
jgi:hypothetical protein